MFEKEYKNKDILSLICGFANQNLKILEDNFNVAIFVRGLRVKITSPNEDNVKQAKQIFEFLYKDLKNKISDLPSEQEVTDNIRLMLMQEEDNKVTESVIIRTAKKDIELKNQSQINYVNLLKKHDITFASGPAGTGKTYLAVAMAVSMYLNHEVDKIILTRPAVEAGERIGFLPGDMKEKVDPYMQPLYDSLHDMIPGDKIQKNIEERIFEIAPLGFMRGRTLKNAFIILDEAQNATSTQMKMFLTRLGQGSRMAINGDISQIDLPKGINSGLSEAIYLLRDINEIGMIEFTEKDVVRHHLVSKIISAYKNLN